MYSIMLVDLPMLQLQVVHRGSGSCSDKNKQIVLVVDDVGVGIEQNGVLHGRFDLCRELGPYSAIHAGDAARHGYLNVVAISDRWSLGSRTCSATTQKWVRFWGGFQNSRPISV